MNTSLPSTSTRQDSERENLGENKCRDSYGDKISKSKSNKTLG